MSGPSLSKEGTTSAVLLLLLPTAPSPGLPGFTAADMMSLEQQLGGAVRMLTVDEASSPAVVRSFAPQHLPTCVLVYQGVELWRQQGLPTSHEIASILHTQLLARHP